MNKFGARIKKLRVFKGLTQEEIASKLYLSLKAYQNIEHGITKLDFERIKQLAIIFSIDATDLINDSELNVMFSVPKISETKYSNINEWPYYPTDLNSCYLLLKEKDDEIAFLRELLNKLSIIKR